MCNWAAVADIMRFEISKFATALLGSCRDVAQLANQQIS